MITTYLAPSALGRISKATHDCRYTPFHEYRFFT